jgi:hypothetical protein
VAPEFFDLPLEEQLRIMKEDTLKSRDQRRAEVKGLLAPAKAKPPPKIPKEVFIQNRLATLKAAMDKLRSGDGGNTKAAEELQDRIYMLERDLAKEKQKNVTRSPKAVPRSPKRSPKAVSRSPKAVPRSPKAVPRKSPKKTDLATLYARLARLRRKGGDAAAERALEDRINRREGNAAVRPGSPKAPKAPRIRLKGSKEDRLADLYAQLGKLRGKGGDAAAERALEDRINRLEGTLAVRPRVRARKTRSPRSSPKAKRSPKAPSPKTGVDVPKLVKMREFIRSTAMPDLNENFDKATEAAASEAEKTNLQQKADRLHQMMLETDRILRGATKGGALDAADATKLAQNYTQMNKGLAELRRAAKKSPAKKGPKAATKKVAAKGKGNEKYPNHEKGTCPVGPPPRDKVCVHGYWKAVPKK